MKQIVFTRRDDRALRNAWAPRRALTTTGRIALAFALTLALSIGVAYIAFGAGAPSPEYVRGARDALRAAAVVDAELKQRGKTLPISERHLIVLRYLGVGN